MNTIVLMLMLAFAPPASTRVWQNGTLADVTRHAADSGTATPMLPGDRLALSYVVYEFTIQTADKIYVADAGVGLISRGVSTATNPIDLEIKSEVTFAVDKQTLYLKDKRGKEYKLGIIKQGFREPQKP